MRKAFKYVKRMVPLFRAVLKLYSRSTVVILHSLSTKLQKQRALFFISLYSEVSVLVDVHSQVLSSRHSTDSLRRLLRS